MPSREREPPEPADGPPERGRGPVARVLARELETLRETLRGWGALGRRLWARRPPASRAAAIAFVAACAAAGAFAVLAQAGLPSRLPSARDWAAARTLLEREARGGDALLLSPAWAERARELAPGNVAVLAQRRYAGEDLLGVRRIWLLAVPDAPGFSWEIEADVLERAARAGPAERIGALELTRFDVAFPTLPLAFLPDRLAQAQVSLGALPCAPGDGLSFRCDGSAPARVAREVREIGGAPRACLAVGVVGGGAPLSIAFPSVRIGRLVRGHVGVPGGGIAEAEPLRVSVVIEGEEAGAAEISGAGFVAFQVDTTRFAGIARPLTLVLTRPAAGADLCLDAVTLP